MFVVKQKQISILNEQFFRKFLLELMETDAINWTDFEPHKERTIQMLRQLQVDTIPLGIEVCQLVMTYHEFGIEEILEATKRRLKTYSLPNLIESLRLILNEIAYKKYRI